MSFTVYVVGFAFSENFESVALIRKNRPEWQKGLLNGIGGQVDPYEGPHEAIVREVHEESGVMIEDWRHYATLNGKDFCVDMFACKTDQLPNMRSMTDEEIVITDTALIHVIKGDAVENLAWLVGLAIDSLHDGRPSFTMSQYPLKP